MDGGAARDVLSVMMPVFNEEATLPVILDHVLKRPEVGEVIAVDDGSTDRSWEQLQMAAAADDRVRLIRHPTNLGKGAALRHAIGELRRPFALVQDADLEYDPRDYPALLNPLLEGHADVVYGVRGFLSHTAYNLWFVLGNRAVTFATNLLFGCYISDMETGYKLMRSELWKRLHLQGDRFDVEPQITARVLRLGYRIHEVPIHYYARGREEGKKLTWRDGVQAMSTLLKLRLAPDRRLFGHELDVAYHTARHRLLSARHPLMAHLREEEQAPGGGAQA